MAKKMKHVGWVVAWVTNYRGRKLKHPIIDEGTFYHNRKGAIGFYETDTFNYKKQNYNEDSKRKRNRVKAIKLFAEVEE